MDLASYVSLNFIDLICRRRDFPVKAETFYDFQCFLISSRPFKLIFSYNKTKIPEFIYAKSTKIVGLKHILHTFKSFCCWLLRYKCWLGVFCIVVIVVQGTTNILNYLARKSLFLQEPPGIFQKIAGLKNNFGNLIENAYACSLEQTEFSWAPPNSYLWNNCLSQSQV